MFCLCPPPAVSPPKGKTPEEGRGERFFSTGKYSSLFRPSFRRSEQPQHLPRSTKWIYGAKRHPRILRGRLLLRLASEFVLLDEYLVIFYISSFRNSHSQAAPARSLFAFGGGGCQHPLRVYNYLKY